ncbi:MAG: hypothetical protein Greene07144_841 [Parcubacteria group bacterium Greene0714_4]|nr:MAG: hypothetical protein Greene07144_841 [Parcubacteria group bacterium Greene0714_4]
MRNALTKNLKKSMSFEKIDERFDNVEISIGKIHEEIDQLRDRVIVLERHTHIG